ncbi:hypothetical protein BC941DRAFT_422730 [Chlamydoabsidia padenii]|nr:hypothetical protein BC941DRAFT_422730 [Chlamydoabsidia padenii]
MWIPIIYFIKTRILGFLFALLPFLFQSSSSSLPLYFTYCLFYFVGKQHTFLLYIPFYYNKSTSISSSSSSSSSVLLCYQDLDLLF